MPQGEAAISPKEPRTARGRKTLRKLLDAATVEFGERGFHEASISSITRRAGVALGSFYTYFDSKDAIFRALVGDLSDAVRQAAASAITEPKDALATEQSALAAFLAFASEHKEIYRIIDEAEFVYPTAYRAHYTSVAGRISERLRSGVAGGELRTDCAEVEAWAIMGMNVFLGLRYAIWSEEGDDLDAVASRAGEVQRSGLQAR